MNPTTNTQNSFSFEPSPFWGDGGVLPFGEVFIEERNNTWNTPFLFNGKELDEETGLYYYGARYYDARVSLWYGVDPVSELAPSWSPYRYCFNSPVNYIDPAGMLDDNYSVDDKGNIKLKEKTNDNFDVLYNCNKSTSIQVDKGVLSNSRTNTVIASNKKEYTFDQYEITGDEKAKKLFEFISDNSDVEWSLTGVGATSGEKGKSILTTSHIKDSEIGGGYLKAYGYTIRKHSHSHPYGERPSPADKKFAESLNLKFPKATLDIYHKEEYFRYDKNGLISIPVMTLPEIEIRTPRKD
ncbi:MAG: JAB-like toxin 1 domain-containing protein [Mangrovibacterium sp.]